jgi:formylglycine-generating enzyme required for sulfatase activity
VFRPPSTPGKRPVTKAEDCPKDMVFIPGGTFKFYGIVPGRTLPVKAEERWVSVPPYCIDQHEVDQRDYLKCILRKECEVPTNYAVQCLTGTQGCTNYRQAETYCKKGTPGLEKRLPFDEELMFAAKGTTNRKYPWGDVEQPLNGSGGGLPLCIYPRELKDYHECLVFVTSFDLSPFGVWGLATNGDEWTASPTCISQPNHCVPAVIVRGCAWPNSMDQYTYPESAPDTPAYGGHLGPWLKFRCALSEF